MHSFLDNTARACYAAGGKQELAALMAARAFSEHRGRRRAFLDLAVSVSRPQPCPKQILNPGSIGVDPQSTPFCLYIFSTCVFHNTLSCCFASVNILRSLLLTCNPKTRFSCVTPCNTAVTGCVCCKSSVDFGSLQFHPLCCAPRLRAIDNVQCRVVYVKANCHGRSLTP